MIKKLTVLILCVAMLSPLVAVFGSAAETKYIVTNPAGAAVYATATDGAAALTAAKYNTVLTATDGNGEFIKVSYDGYVGWVRTADVSLYGVSLHVRELLLTSLPTKTVYYEDDAFETDGLIVKAVYSDGTVAAVTGYDVMVPDMYSVGEKTVRVSYKGKSAEFVITVNRLPIDRIVVSTPPKSIDIIEDTDKPVLPGMVLTVYYTNGREPKEVTDYTLTNYDPKKLGRQTATVNYKYPDVNTTVEINVVAKSVIGLAVTTPPEKTVYYDDNLKIELGGLVLTAKYNNGKAATVTPESAVFRGGTPVSGAYNDIVLAYGGFHASFEVRVEKTEILGISVTPPFKTKYVPGEQPDLGGMVVYLEYNSGVRTGIEDYEVEDFDTATFGKKTVNVYYESYSASFTVEVASIHSLGDINADGHVNAADARMALRYAARVGSLTAEQLWLGDVNKDGKVTSSDARALLRHAARIELIAVES